jgi:tRNA G10  N-methylase Trm11
VDGPFLKPIDLPDTHFLPPSLVVTRRYRGKTNEVFTQFMCNIARYSSRYRATPWRRLTLLDPLAGGGTTLFVGLMLGADVAGVENDKKVVDGTIAFLKPYLREGRIPAKFREDRLKNVGKRWFITLDQTVRCVVGRGDTTDVKHFVHGLKRPQLIVTDLPYGIQHHEAWHALLVEALPAWAAVMAEGGTLAFSWNATRFSREEMITLVQEVSDFKVINDAPYDQLAHRVDRVIKQRDVIVAQL